MSGTRRDAPPPATSPAPKADNVPDAGLRSINHCEYLLKHAGRGGQGVANWSGASFANGDEDGRGHLFREDGWKLMAWHCR